MRDVIVQTRELARCADLGLVDGQLRRHTYAVRWNHAPPIETFGNRCARRREDPPIFGPNELDSKMAPGRLSPQVINAPEEVRLRYSGVFWLSAALLSLATLLSVRADPSVVRAGDAPAADIGASASFGSNRSRLPLQLLLLHVPRSGGRSLECTFDGQKFNNAAFKSTQQRVSASFDRNVSLCCGGHSTLSSLLRRFGNATRPVQVSCAKRSESGRVRGLARLLRRTRRRRPGHARAAVRDHHAPPGRPHRLGLLPLGLES